MRKRKSPTREERRRAWAQAGAEASSALLAPALADPTFHDQYETALRALESDDLAVYGPALSALVESLHRLVPITKQDQADKWLGFHLTYDAARRAGLSEAEAHAAARSLRPLSYPISTDKDAAEFDLQGNILLPFGATRDGIAAAARFHDDVLSNASPLGRPRGRLWTKVEWQEAYRAADADLRRQGSRRTDAYLATNMALNLSTFRAYKREYGVPLT